MRGLMDRDMAQGKPLDSDELEQQVISMIALGSTMVAGAAWLSVAPGRGFSWWRVLVFFTLVVESVAIYWANGKHRNLTKAVLLLGPALSLAIALHTIPSPAVPCFAVLAVIANSAVSLTLSLAAVLLHTVVLCVFLPVPNLLVPILALIWLAATLQWISARGRRTILQWAWHSQQQATRLLEEVRDRQGELNRALRAMDEANARLALANERLAEARRIADDAREAKRRFAVNVSHELRTPLNVIVGFTEVMFSTPQAYPGTVLSPGFLVDLGAVHQSAQHLHKLIGDVLDLAQLEAGKFALRPVNTDLAAVVEEAVATVRNMAEVRGLSLTTRLAPALPHVYVDRTRIKQVCLNLLSNAIRYTDEGTIDIAAHSDGREVFCSVSDTGPGIPEEQQRRLFEEFERVTRGTRSAQEGSGLGLAISKRLVQEHGGRIWLESRPGLGTKLTFALPVLTEQTLPQPAQIKARPVPERPTAEGDPVLLLTPSMMAARLFSRHLEGYRCVSTSDLQQAVRQVAELQPLGIVVDAEFGAEAASLLERAAKQKAILNTPVVVCPLPGQSQRLRLAGVKGYLTKPVTRQDLLDTLRAYGGEIETVLVIDDDEDVLRLLRTPNKTEYNVVQ